MKSYRSVARFVWLASTACSASSPAVSGPGPVPSALPSAVPVARGASTSSAEAAPPSVAPFSPAPAGTAAALAAEYRGTVGKDLAIVARLHRAGDHVHGAYFYEKSGADLTLDGTVAGASVKLDELASKTRTGSFEAILAADGSLTGTWRSAKGDRTLPLHLAPLVAASPLTKATVFKKTLRSTKPVVGKKSKDEACDTELEYAEVFGVPAAAAEKINARLAPSEEVLPPDPCDHARSSGSTYAIEHDDDGILSARKGESFLDSLAAHPGSRGTSSVNVFLETGTDVKLYGDVLPPKSEALLRAAVRPVVDAVARREKWEPEDTPLVLDALANTSTFVFEKEGLRIFPDALPLAAAALGADGFLVPYGKLPRPGGRVAALWAR